MAPYEMWYGHIPSVRHLRVFGSFCYALIPKEHIKNLVQGVANVSSLDTHTSKEYHLYDEVNKKFIISRDVIFLEYSKTNNVVERQLDHLDRFRHAKYFQEFDNEIPHLKGGIHILDQSVEYFFQMKLQPLMTL